MDIEIIPFIIPVYNSGEYEVEKAVINRVALIDADRYKHVVTYRVYQKIMDEGHEHSKALVNEQIDNYLTKDIFNCFEATAYVFCFSAPSKDVFRNSIAQEKKYKGNREGRKDPNFYTNKYDDMKYIYDYISSRYQTLIYNDLEADDLLSMLQNDQTFIFSHDKDLKQVPGFHWDIEKGVLVLIEENQGLNNLLSQLLKGDSTDNIPGLKGFGEKALEDVLKVWSKERTPIEDKMHHVIYHYTNKLGLLNGIDTFVEMWSLLSMKINRGKYLQEKYSEAFLTIKNLCDEIKPNS